MNQQELQELIINLTAENIKLKQKLDKRKNDIQNLQSLNNFLDNWITVHKLRKYLY